MKLNIVCALAVLLLVGGVSQRQRDRAGVSPDDRLTLAETVPAMQAALDDGADPQGTSFPALSYCATRNFIPGLKLLLERGAQPDGAPHSRPLILAVAGGHLEAATLLLQHGANPNITNAHGQTPLQILATRPPNLGLRNVLLAAGARPSNNTATRPALYNGLHDRSVSQTD